MAWPELSDLIAEARRLVVDTSSTDPAAADAVYTARLNENYVRYCAVVDRRFQAMAATTSGAYMVAAQSSTTLTPTNIAEIGQVFWTIGGPDESTPTSSNITLTPLERVSWDYYIRTRGPLNTNLPDQAGTPEFYAVRRVATDTDANIGKWELGVWPPPGALSYFPMYVRLTPALLSSSSDKMDLSDEATWWVVRLAAADIANMIGEDDAFIARILAPVPQQILESMGVKATGVRPDGEAAVTAVGG